MTSTLRSNLADAVLCHVNGWEVGAVLEGVEYDPADDAAIWNAHRIQITAIGETMILARAVAIHHDGKWQRYEGRESSWTLTCREWRRVG